jgi:hypothetical protein
MAPVEKQEISRNIREIIGLFFSLFDNLLTQVIHFSGTIWEVLQNDRLTGAAYPEP